MAPECLKGVEAFKGHRPINNHLIQIDFFSSLANTKKIGP